MASVKQKLAVTSSPHHTVAFTIDMYKQVSDGGGDCRVIQPKQSIVTGIITQRHTDLRS